jgi:deoxycytidylate deaminase
MKEYPYIPKNREILYVSANNKFMIEAQRIAEQNSLDLKFKTGAIIVKNNKIIGRGVNGSTFHKKFGCVRKFFGVTTGKHYWICPGCSPKNHAEQSAIKNALSRRISLEGADLYLWGHWWCCQSCWRKMIEVKIKNVYLVENAKDLFAKKI